MWNKTWMVRLAGVAGCAATLTSAAFAEEGAPRTEERRAVVLRQAREPRQEEGDAQARAGSHWLGLECFPLDAALRSHLGLAEGEGLMIEQIVPDSPAAKAELKQHDVIVKAGSQTIKSLPDLMKAVEEAKESELALEIIRGGKPMTMKAMPARRPEAQDVLRRLPRGRDDSRATDELRNWMERFSEPGGGLRYRILGPGAVLPGSEKGLPKGLSVSITRSGGEPTKIMVKKGEQSWEVGEKELDKLPDDVRPHVERLLGRGTLALPGMPPMPPVVAPPLPHVRPEVRRSEGTDKQLKEMMDQLDKLRRQMDELQRSLPKESKPPANESRA